jgi:ABC-type Zn uptake system ZnuABC Zn-binding protein ZnuA
VLRALALALLAAAPAQGGGVLDVVATSTDLKALVEAVGGERVRVESLAPALHEPHAVEVKPGQLARLKSAALLVRIGLDHEPWLARVRATVNDPRFAPGGVADLDASRGIDLLQIETPRVTSDRGAHVHGFGNPHYWLDPANARRMTQTILDGLVRLAPDAREVFGRNRAAFLERLDLGLKRWTDAMAPHRGARVVAFHDSWPYFARRFGLVVAATVEPVPCVPPTPASLAALTAGMKDAGVRVLIVEPSASRAVADRVAAPSGARVVTLVPSVGGDPEARDYLTLFDVNVRRLAEALARAR